MSAGRPVPRPTPESAAFWDGLRAGHLRIQRCRSCGRAYLPPQPSCPACASTDVGVEVARGLGTVVSAVVSHLPAPGFEPPFVLAVVELAEGPRLLTNIVGGPADLDAVPPDLPVVVSFETFDGTTLPLFRTLEP
jgi:uncharacterized protein